jgi:phosphotransferase system HPr-like phosphotransfer protein
MALKAPHQTMVFFAAEGPDSAAAVRALVDLVQSDFTNAKDPDP